MRRRRKRLRAGSRANNGELIIRNEFAHVSIDLDLSANGPRLRVQDLRGGKEMFLDPLELEALAWATHGDLEEILDPSHRRWKDDETET